MIAEWTRERYAAWGGGARGMVEEVEEMEEVEEVEEMEEVEVGERESEGGVIARRVRRASRMMGLP